MERKIIIGHCSFFSICMLIWYVENWYCGQLLLIFMLVRLILQIHCQTFFSSTLYVIVLELMRSLSSLQPNRVVCTALKAISACSLEGMELPTKVQLLFLFLFLLMFASQSHHTSVLFGCTTAVPKSQSIFLII